MEVKELKNIEKRPLISLHVTPTPVSLRGIKRADPKEQNLLVQDLYI